MFRGRLVDGVEQQVRIQRESPVRFPFHPREDLFDIVETADQAGAEVEANRPVSCWRCTRGVLERGQPDPQRFIHHRLQWSAALSHRFSQRRGHIVFQS